MKIENMKIGKVIVSILLVSTLLFSIFNIFRVGAKEPSIILTNAIIESKSDTIEGGINSFDSTKVVSNVTYHKLNDYVTYKLTLKNNENKEIKILDITDDNTFEHIVYEYDKHTDEVIDSKNSFDLVIKASYKNEAEYNAESNKEVKIKITYEMEDEKKEEVVPITGDNLYIYIILLIVSIIGLVIAFVTNKKVKKVMILLLLITPFITKALTDSTIITISGNIKIQDKQTVKFKVGNEETSKIVNWGSKVDKPEDPEKAGYNFLGWSLGDNLYNFDNVVKSDITLEAKFEPKDVTYRVIHKQQNLNNDEYAEFETQELPGKYNQEVTPDVKSYTGFTSPSTQTVTLGTDTTVTYEYKRNSYKVTYQYEGTVPSNPPELPEEKTYKYGANVPIESDVTLTGYNFSGWDTASAFTMPDHDVVIKGSFTAKGDTPYTVEHYWQHIGDNDYELHETVPLTGQTDTEATATSNQYTGFTYDENNSNNIKSGNIERDGSRVLKLYYNRNVRKVIYTFTNEPNGHSALPAEESYRYGATVTVKGLATAPGYSFAWDRTGTFTMPDENVTITGTFTPRDDTAYTVEHYFENINDNNYTIDNTLTDNETGTTDTQATASPKTITGFTQDSTIEGTVSTGNIDGDGTRVLKLYYKRNKYNVTYSYTNDPVPTGASSLPSTTQQKYEATVNVSNPENTTATGYTFDGWYKGSDKVTSFTMQNEAVTLTGTFTANTYSIRFNKNDNDAAGTMDDLQMTYDVEANLTANAFTKQGYHFTKWTTNPDGTGTEYTDGVSVKNLATSGTFNLYANYAPDDNIAYKVEHYFENINDNNYTIDNTLTDNEAGTTGETVYAVAKTVTGFTNDTTVDGTITSGPVAADGSLTLKLYYTRNKYNVTYSYTNDTVPTGASDLPTIPQQKYGATVNVSNPENTTATGYTFDGWYKGSDKVTSFTMQNEAVTLTGTFTANTYSIRFNKNDNDAAGTMDDLQMTYDVEANLTANAFTKQGYHFTKWTTNPDGTGTEYTDGVSVKNLATSGTFNLYANYEPNTNTQYKVSYYYQNNGTYGEALSSDTRYGTTDAEVSVTSGDKTPTQIGYILDDDAVNKLYSGNIAPDGSLELKVFFKKQFSITYAPGEHGTFSQTTTNSLNYNADTPTPPEITGDDGYHFTGWDPERTEKVTQTVTYTALWAPNTNTAYKVLYYYQVSGSYEVTPAEVTRYGTTGAEVSVTNDDKVPNTTGYALDDNASGKLYTSTIAGNGSTELKIYFKQQFSVTYAPGAHGTFEETTTNNLDYNADTPAPPEITGESGYEFASWDPQISPKVTQNTTYTALWTQAIANYKTEHYHEQLDGSYVLHETVNGSGTIGNTANAEAIDYSSLYYHLDETNENRVTSGTINAEGTLTLKLYYNLDTYTITFNSTLGDTYNGDAVVDDITITKKHGATLTLSELPTKPTYSADTQKPSEGLSVDKRHNALDGWYTEASEGTKITEPIVITEDKVYFAYWTEVPIMCKTGTYLHTETCERDDSHGCHANGYSDIGYYETTTIVYGETSDSTTPKYGDVYDCDINNDQIYDSELERFYFVGTDTNGNYRLLFSSNWDGEQISTLKNFTWTDAGNKIPNGKHTQWFNTDTAANVVFPDKVKIATLCGEQYKECDYLMEKSAYHVDVDNQNPKQFRSGIWLRDGDEYWRLQTSTLEFQTKTAKNAIKPVIVVPASRIETNLMPTYQVHFDSRGGTIGTDGEIQTLNIPGNSAIRVLPIPTKENNNFKGWYTNTNFDTPVQLPIIVTGESTYYAKWASTSGNVAEINGIEYPTLQAAINTVEENGENPTTIILLKDTSEEVLIDGNRNIKLDLEGQNVSNTGADKHVFTINSGSSLQIYGGTVTSDADTSMIYVNGGTVNFTGGAYNATGTGDAVSNNGGTVNISVNSVITSTSSTNPAILNNGTLNIQLGTIKSTGGIGIYNETGSLIIGRIEDLNSLPIIQGKTYGIVSEVNYDYYDGTIKGGTYPVGVSDGTTTTDDTEKSKIEHRETDTIYIHGSETQGPDLYQTMTLKYFDNVFVLTFDANAENGNPRTQTVVINRESQIGVLPSNPTRSHYSFVGWYKTAECNDGDEVTAETIPTADPSLDPNSHETAYITYYAKWEEKTTIENTVTFISDSATYTTKTVDEGEVLDEIPSPTKENFDLDGWYTEENGNGTKLTADTVFNADATYYAYWVDISSYVAVIKKIDAKNTYYTTLPNAISAVPQNGTSATTITLVNNITNPSFGSSSNSQAFKVEGNRNIKLDLNNKTISSNSNSKNHIFAVMSGSKLELTNGTITASALTDSMLHVNSGATLNITSGTYTASGTRQIVFNEGSTTISGSPEETILTTSSNERPTVHNKGTSATMNIIGGSITSTSAYGVYVQSGTVNIGTKDGTTTKNNPIIKGETYGVLGYGKYNLYDGIIKGKEYSIANVTTTADFNPTEWDDDPTGTKINEIETNTTNIFDTENQGQVIYKTLYLKDNNTIYTISFNSGEAGSNATLSFSSLIIDRGEEIGMLPIATWDSTHTLEGWYTSPSSGDEVTIETVPTGNTMDITYYAHWSEVVVEYHTVSFNANGGSGTMNDVPNLTGTYNLPENAFTAPEGKRFKGWSLTSNGEIITSVQMTEDRTVYAIWEDSSIICHLVTDQTKLKQETCNAANNTGCKAANTGNPITYGSVYTNSLNSGTALDCKLTSNGDYTDRFYYLRTVNDEAVLISHSILSNATPATLVANDHEFLYDDAISALPTTATWDHLTNNTRLATVEDIRTACNVNPGTSNGNLDNCTYVLAGIKTFTGIENSSRSFYWVAESGGTYYRIDGANRKIANKEGSKNSIKVVIDVPLNLIDIDYYKPKITVTYDPNGGTVSTTSVQIPEGQALGSSYKTPTYENYIFDGWYDEDNNLIDDTTPITESMTLTAHWTKSVKLADIDTRDVIINDNDNNTHQISANITRSLPTESFTFASSDDTIASVNSTGLITANAEGKATITIEGDRSHETRTVKVYVTNINIVEYDASSNAIKVYYNNIDTWKEDPSNFPTWENNNEPPASAMKNNFDANMCLCADGQCTSVRDANTHCDKPVGYDTGTNKPVNVYVYNLETSNHNNTPVTYADSTNGFINNLIPDKVYYWETTDNSSSGYIMFTSNRRFIDAGDVLNVRDLGGLPVDTNDDGIIDGYTKYERLIRGIRLSSSNSASQLTKLGITKELDLRSQSEASNDYNNGYILSDYERISIQNYMINDDVSPSNYTDTRAAVKKTMQDIVANKNIYFHCRIGTDRTGTLAYILEGLLGVPEEERVEDYELSFFYGLVRIHRYHDKKPSTQVPKRFVYMHEELIPTNADIYEWYVRGSTNVQEDKTLIENFRTAMIDYLS